MKYIPESFDQMFLDSIHNSQRFKSVDFKETDSLMETAVKELKKEMK